MDDLKNRWDVGRFKIGDYVRGTDYHDKEINTTSYGIGYRCHCERMIINQIGRITNIEEDRVIVKWISTDKLENCRYYPERFDILTEDEALVWMI